MKKLFVTYTNRNFSLENNQTIRTGDRHLTLRLESLFLSGYPACRKTTRRCFWLLSSSSATQTRRCVDLISNWLKYWLGSKSGMRWFAFASKDLRSIPNSHSFTAILVWLQLQRYNAAIDFEISI